jgi:hypothetical protein
MSKQSQNENPIILKLHEEKEKNDGEKTGINITASEYIICQRLHYKHPVLHPKPGKLKEYLTKYPDIIQGKRWFRFVISKHTKSPWIQQGDLGFGESINSKSPCSIDCKHSMLALAGLRSKEDSINNLLNEFDKKISNNKVISTKDKTKLNKLIKEKGGIDVISAGSGQFKIDENTLKVCLNTKSGHYKPSIDDCKRAIPYFRAIIDELINEKKIKFKKENVQIYCTENITTKEVKEKGKLDAKENNVTRDALLVCQSGACFPENLVKKEGLKQTLYTYAKRAPNLVKRIKVHKLI